MAKKAKSTDLVRVARATRDVGRVVAREVGRSRLQANAGQVWRADQVQRHKAAARQVRRHRRRIERAERGLVRNSALSVGGVALFVVALLQGWGGVAAVLMAIATAAAAARAVYWSRERREARAIPPPPPPPPLPPAGVTVSETWPFVIRLDRAVRAWEQLEPLLFSIGWVPGPAPTDPATARNGHRRAEPGETLDQVTSAREVAYMARDEINARISAVQALEAASVTAPPLAAEHLRWGVAEGLAGLETALQAYENFIAAASAAVVAGGATGVGTVGVGMRGPLGGPATGAVPGPDRLAEATDALAGLAYALRELRSRAAGGTYSA